MDIAQWRAAEAVLVMESPTSVGCRATTVAMKDAGEAANAGLPSKREVPARFSRVPFSARRTHSHPIKRHAVTRLRKHLEICKTNAVPKDPLSILGLKHIGRVETCTANLSLAPAIWSKRRPKRWSSSATATTSVELGRFIMAAWLKDFKADWIRTPTCFPLIEQCMLKSFCYFLCAFFIHFFLAFYVVVISLLLF